MRCIKQRHDTKAAAQAHLRALADAGARRTVLHVYRCPTCSVRGQPAVWHVGHWPGIKRRRVA